MTLAWFGMKLRSLIILAPVIFAAARAGAQSSARLLGSTEGPTLVRLVQVVPEKGGTAVEILSSHPLTPAIKSLSDPPRLVIDLPSARLTWDKRRVDFHNQEINGVRVNQYQSAPPITRVVVDLARPLGYTWDAAGNRLVIRMKPTSQQGSENPTSVPAFTQGMQPAILPLNSGAPGSVLLAGSRVPAGSSVTAGSDTAILRLGRGGEVRVCPQTTVSVTSSQNGRSLMFGMSTGAMEAQYTLDASADSVLTPDFRILLPGPGEFHYAISADSRGNTCIQGLSGNNASVIVSELLGDGTYQVKPTEQIVFHSGHLNAVDSAVPMSCGCPPAPVPILRAAGTVEPVSGSVPSSVHSPQSHDRVKPPVSSHGGPSTAEALTADPRQTADPPVTRPNDIHVQVDAPLVFQAEDPHSPGTSRELPSPAPTAEAELLPLSERRPPALLSASPVPPQRPHHGLLGKLKGLFVAIFR